MESTDNERAEHACKACKLRKKACDKALPRCGGCVRRKVECSYEEGPSSTSAGQLAIGTITELLACTSRPLLDGFLNLQVCRIEYLSGISVVKALERYVRHFHHWLCVVDGNLFEASLVKWSNGVPPADFSILAMTLYLFSIHGIEIRELYMLTRLLQTHLQTISAGQASPSLVQSYVLLAAFEYSCGNPQAAFLSISNAARLDSLQQNSPPQQQDVFSSESRQEAARNTTLSIVVLERLILLEMPNPTSYNLTTTFPTDSKVPVTASGDFTRLVSSTFYLDKLFGVLRLPADEDQVNALIALDSELLTYLNSEITSQGHSHHSDAIATATRSLYLLHQNLLQLARACGHVQCQRSSQQALDTMARMILGAAQSHHGRDGIEGMCLSSAYNLSVPLKHAEIRRDWVESEGVGAGIEEARRMLETFRGRWRALV